MSIILTTNYSVTATNLLQTSADVKHISLATCTYPSLTQYTKSYYPAELTITSHIPDSLHVTPQVV